MIPYDLKSNLTLHCIYCISLLMHPFYEKELFAYRIIDTIQHVDNI